MIIAVSGWRRWSFKSTLTAVIASTMNREPHGSILDMPLFRFGDNEHGIDEMMLELVAEWHLPYERYVADLDQHGKAAGPLRNRAMLRGTGYTDIKANFLLAFPEPRALPKIPGSGTWGCIGEASAMQIPALINPAYPAGWGPSGYSVDIFGK